MALWVHATIVLSSSSRYGMVYSRNRGKSYSGHRYHLAGIMLRDGNSIHVSGICNTCILTIVIGQAIEDTIFADGFLLEFSPFLNIIGILVVSRSAVYVLDRRKANQVVPDSLLHQTWFCFRLSTPYESTVLRRATVYSMQDTMLPLIVVVRIIFCVSHRIVNLSRHVCVRA